MMSTTPQPETNQNIVYLDAASLNPHPLNPRGHFPDDDSIEELKKSIEENGILQPLIVLADGTIIIGHRRYRAGCHAEITKRWSRQFPCIIREMSADEQLATMLVENLQRQDLNPVQEATGYWQLHKTGMSRADVARRCSVSYQRVGQLFDLLKLNRELFDFFADYRLPLSAIAPLSRLDSEQQRVFGLRAASQRWSASRIEKAVNAHLNGNGTPERKRTTNNSVIGNLGESSNPPLETLLASLNAKGKVHLPVSKIVECAAKVDCGCSGAPDKDRKRLCSVCQFAGFLADVLKEAHDAG